MPRLNRLNAVAHDIGHWAASGRNLVSFHLMCACIEHAQRDVTVSLLDAHPYPASLPFDTGLAGLFGELHARFLAMLAHERWTPDAIEAAMMQFIVRDEVPWPGSSFEIVVQITANGRTIRMVQPA